MQQRRPPLYLPTNVMVAVPAHTPCQGGGGGAKRPPWHGPHRRGCAAGCPSLRTIRFDMFRGSNLTGCSFPEGAPWLEYSSSFSSPFSSAKVRDVPDVDDESDDNVSCTLPPPLAISHVSARRSPGWGGETVAK